MLRQEIIKLYWRALSKYEYWGKELFDDIEMEKLIQFREEELEKV